MGLDQTIYAAKDGVNFPMKYWRKNFNLNQDIIAMFNIDTSACVFSIELTPENVELIREKQTSLKERWFWEYLINHMNLNVDYNINHVPFREYTYFYQADW